jgi:nucleoside-diphosphate-sugar epimerase
VDDLSRRDGDGVEYALVTGGAGFIGSHLCAALLARGLGVICLDNLSTGRLENLEPVRAHPRFTVQRTDVAEVDIAALLLEELRVRPSYIFHLASPASVVDYLRLPLETLRVNSEGTRRVLELARVASSRVLYASTSEIYGDPLEHPQAETYWGNVNPNGPRSCYDESKRFGEALVAQYGRSYGLDARIVRIFNTYGPHSRPDDGRVVPNFVAQALQGDAITLYGDGAQTRSFCYVSDLVAGLQAVMFAPGQAGEVFNLGNPRECTIAEFAEIVARVCGLSAAQIERRPLPVDDPTRRQPDISKARHVLGWEPMVDLEAGLTRTVEWFRRTLNLETAPTLTVGAGAHGSVKD